MSHQISRLLRVECIKLKRNWALVLIVLVPLCQVFFLGLIIGFSGPQFSDFGSGHIAWDRMNSIAWNWVAMPLMIALFTSLSWDVEIRSDFIQYVQYQPVTWPALYIAKFMNSVMMVLLSHGILLVLLFVGAIILNYGVPSLGMGGLYVSKLAFHIVKSFLASIPILCFHLSFSLYFQGLGSALLLFVVGNVAAFAVPDSNWASWLLPWKQSSMLGHTALMMGNDCSSLGRYLWMLFWLVVTAWVGVRYLNRFKTMKMGGD